MNKFFAAILVAGLITGCSSSKNTSMNDIPNELSETEKSEGWQLLFNGENLNGWHSWGKTSAGSDWKIEDSALVLVPNSSAKDGGDLVTDAEYGDFHFSAEWKISTNGNSGIIFYVQDDTSKYQTTWNTGLEMQVLDNAGHPDAKIFKHRAGDLYDLIPSDKEVVKPAGEWNHAEIVSKEGKLEMFLNGTKVVSTQLWNENWKSLVAGSKFKDMPGWGTFKKGHIALQDHGDKVWYRNIKIKPL